MTRELLIEPLSGQPMLLPATIDPVPLIEAEAEAREKGDEETLEAANTAIGTHNSSTEAHTDIRTSISNNTTLIKALQGVGGYLTAHDFGVAVPLQQALTDYALEQIAITDPLEIFNGTKIKNTFNNHVWVLANTPDTTPPVFEWIDDGDDVVDVPNTSIADISADADDAVVTSGTLVTLLKSLSGRIKALLARFHPTTGHAHTGADSPKIAYSNITDTPDIPAAQVNSDWNATEGVAQILNKPAIQLSTPVYTFIVDSNEALAAWANNAAGNDYSHVFIKKGTWTSDKGVNLSIAGTKVVVGDVDSLLNFTSKDALMYSSLPTSPEYWMLGVNVVAFSIDQYGVAESYLNCTNLTNCTGTSTGTGKCCVYENCTNLTNCAGYSTSNSYGFLYTSCKNLTNCTGTSTGVKSCCVYGFCKNLTNCTGTGNSTESTGYCYNQCTNLTNCTGISNSEKNSGYCYSDCKNLTNCTGTGTGNSWSCCYYQCTNLMNCTGTGTSNDYGYGYINCNIMIFCKPGAASTTATYNMCYMHASSMTDPVADTAEGGWNVS